MAFASKFDPQPFHLSVSLPKEACSAVSALLSWHTASMWMRHNVAAYPQVQAHAEANGGPVEFGPAAGLRDLKWLQACLCGRRDRVRANRREPSGADHAPRLAALTSRCEAANQAGQR